MLNLEQQVCSLELAQKLKALNVKQESLWIWIERTYAGQVTGANPKVGVVLGTDLNKSEHHLVSDKMLCSAFTVAENLEEMPECIYKKHAYYLTIRKVEAGSSSGYEVFYRAVNGKKACITFDMLLAEAVGKMRVYLLEQKLITKV